jgi:hypothetical protein
MNDLVDGITKIGAGAGGASLVWNVLSFFLGRRTQVNVGLSGRTVGNQSGVEILVSNRHPTQPIEVKGMDSMLAKGWGRRREVHEIAPGSDPAVGTIAGGAAQRYWVPRNWLLGLEPGIAAPSDPIKGLKVRVWLGNGKAKKSRSTDV